MNLLEWPYGIERLEMVSGLPLVLVVVVRLASALMETAKLDGLVAKVRAPPLVALSFFTLTSWA